MLSFALPIASGIDNNDCRLGSLSARLSEQTGSSAPG